MWLCHFVPALEFPFSKNTSRKLEICNNLWISAVFLTCVRQRKYFKETRLDPMGLGRGFGFGHVACHWVCGQQRMEICCLAVQILLLSPFQPFQLAVPQKATKLQLFLVALVPLPSDLVT